MYIVLKVTQEQIVAMGSVFEAARGHWVLDPDRASQCSAVVVVTNKQVQEVFKADAWYPSTLCEGRFVFAGWRNLGLTHKLQGCNINPALCLKGAENPVRYVEESELLAQQED